jgi:hypothetical protein
MKKLAKAQMGKIVKSVGNTLLKKRPTKQVFGAASAITGGLGTAAAISTYQAKKQFAEREKSPKGVAQKKKYEDLKKQYPKSFKKKMGGSIKKK